MNFLKDLLNGEEFKQYQLTSYPFNLDILDTALKAKLKEDTEYEAFIPMIYYKYVPLLKNVNEPVLIEPYKYFISNKGNVLSLRRKDPVLVGWSLNKNGYPRLNLQIGAQKQIKILLHRAIACSWIPLRDELGVAAHPKDLEVNHVDGIKINHVRSNLEWTTGLENKEHAKATGLIPQGEGHYAVKPIKGTVLIGKFKGLEFLLIGSKSMITYGFSKEVVSRCCLGKIGIHRNCSFAYATDKEIYTLPRELSGEAITAIFEIGKGVISDIVATHLESGEKLLIRRGKPELRELGFDESCVTKVIKGKLKSHKGYVFERTQSV